MYYLSNQAPKLVPTAPIKNVTTPNKGHLTYIALSEEKLV